MWWSLGSLWSPVAGEEGKRKNPQSGYADYPGSCRPWGWLSPSILCGSPYRKSHPGVLAGWQLPRDPWQGPCGNSQRAAPRRRSSLSHKWNACQFTLQFPAFVIAFLPSAEVCVRVCVCVLLFKTRSQVSYDTAKDDLEPLNIFPPLPKC